MQPEKFVLLANEAEIPVPPGCADLVGCANEFISAEDEWIEVPYGDVPYALGKVNGLQRLNKTVAVRMVELFNSWRGKLTRRFGGMPFYVGHPDHPAFANEARDNKAYGWVKELQARDDSLALKVDWSEAGRELLANKFFKWFSPFFLGREAGTQNGQKVYEPVWLQSCGLTNNPRWPVAALVNQMQEDGSMDLLQRLIALLGLGKDGAEDASEDGVISAVTKLLEAAKKLRESVDAKWDAEDAAYQAVPNEAPVEDRLGVVLQVLDGRVEALTNEKTGIETQLAEAQAAHTEAAESLKAERKARIELLVNQAVADGRITPAQKPQWLGDLESAEDFDAKAAALANAKPAIKTQSHTQNLGDREGKTQSNQEKILALVNERMNPARHGADYHDCFQAVKREHPDLFGQEENGD